MKEKWDKLSKEIKATKKYKIQSILVDIQVFFHKLISWYKKMRRKIMRVLSGGSGVIGFKYPWNSYGWYNYIIYPFFKKPYYAYKLMKDVEFYPWDLVNSSVDILFIQYQQFFENNEEELKPWLEDGKWQEHKHSENWEGTKKGSGSGLTYKDMLEIYMYIKYIRHENEKKKDDLLHLLLSDENYKTWWEDCDEVYDGSKRRPRKTPISIEPSPHILKPVSFLFAVWDSSQQSKV